MLYCLGRGKQECKVEKEKFLVTPKLEKLEGQQESPEISSTQGRYLTFLPSWRSWRVSRRALKSPVHKVGI
jgi:hypothetical protein